MQFTKRLGSSYCVCGQLLRFKDSFKDAESETQWNFIFKLHGFLIF